MGSFPNGLPLGMFGWSKYKILPVYGEKRPIYVHSYLDTNIYKTNVIPSIHLIWKEVRPLNRLHEELRSD